MKSITRTYDDDRELHKDTARLSRLGYTPVVTTTAKGHAGTSSGPLNFFLAIFTGGLGLLAARTPPRTTVTYRCPACK